MKDLMELINDSIDYATLQYTKHANEDLLHPVNLVDYVVKETTEHYAKGIRALTVTRGKNLTPHMKNIYRSKLSNHLHYHIQKYVLENGV